MDDAQLDDRFETATALAREAGALAHGYFRRFEELSVRRKGLQDEVSEADVAVETLIRERLSERFPEDAFLGEESGLAGGAAERDDAAPVWVVDPIDGTACFVSGIPTWCVSIACVVGDTIPIGVVYDPNSDELFAARRGAGATVNGRPIRPSEASGFDEGLVGIGYSTRTPPMAAIGAIDRLLGEGGMFVRNGSGALMITYVAAGRLLGYYEAHMQSWDGAAAVGIVREAGGWTSDFLADGGLTRGNSIAASGPHLAPAMRRLAGLG